MRSQLSQHSLFETNIYSSEEISLLDPLLIPKHVAIVMDGNRRWARQRGFPSMVGHWKGGETLTKIVRAAEELGIKTLTVFAFSTENWNRSPIEINSLMRILKSYLQRKKHPMIEEGVRLNVIGEISKLPENIQKTLSDTVSATQNGEKFNLVLALNYGGRDDIYRAMKAIIEDCDTGKIGKEDLSEQLISKYIDTAPWGDPELLIRTGRENRLSNFLLWQISYSEVHVADALWPEFSEKDFFHAILDYQKRERRWGR